MSLKHDPPSDLMPGEATTSRGMATDEMPSEMPSGEMPRGEMPGTASIAQGALGEMPRGEMAPADPMAEGDMPRASGGGDDAGPGGMPLGLMTGGESAAAPRPSGGTADVELPGTWRLVLSPVSAGEERN